VSDLAAYLEQLGRAHGFTRAELDSNREGVVHPSQRARGQRGAVSGPVSWVIFVGLVLVGGLGGAYAFVEGSGSPLSRVDRNAVIAILGATALCTLGFTAAGVSSVRRAARRREAFRSPAVAVIEGLVSKGAVRGSASVFWLDLAGRRFSVSRHTWELVTHGAMYRGYVINEELVTFEPVVV
jgi:hypothetical protein